MKKNLTTPLLIFFSLTFITCERDFNPFDTSNNEQGDIRLVKIADCSEQLNTDIYTGNITIDRLGQIWYSTAFCDTTIKIPPESNIYCKGLWKICTFDGNKYCTIFDSLDYVIDEIQLDIKGNIWIMNSKQIIKIDAQNRLSIIYDNSNKDGFFNSIAVDKNYNIWVGGLKTGIFKITDSKINQYNSTNSPLPTNSITKILIDANNTKWIALWDLQGLIKIENENWTHYNSTNSNISQQNIWDLARDSNGNLWLGTGWTDSSITLMKFDGIKFSIENPKNIVGNKIPGTVRHIAADKASKVYVISVVTKHLSSYSTALSIYDGATWSNKFITYGEDMITDIEVYNNELWLSTFTEIYKVE